MKKVLSVLPIAVLILAGCTAARIVAPVQSPRETISQCLRVMSVRFHNKFKPGTFRAELDGGDVTPLFSLPHNPGGTSVWAIQAPFTGGEPILGQKIITVPQWPGASIVNLPSGYYLHKLHTDGECVSPQICGTDNSEFVPLHLFGRLNSPNAPNFSSGSEFPAVVVASIIPSVPVQVEVVPTANVSLYDPSVGIWQPGGTSISLTIPTNNDRAFFAVRGSRGYYNLVFVAPGCQEGRIWGYIQ
jgi:hypothetical protein